MYNKSVTSKEKGNRGEDLAVSDYVNRGYRILERNYRCPYGEIDAVLEKNSLIVFLEVKVVDFSGMESLADLINARKRKKISESARHYLTVKKQENRDFRFDVAAVLSDIKSVTTFENAFTE